MATCSSGADIRTQMVTTPFALQAASADGALYTLTIPRLQLMSRVSMFPNHPASLLCSPDHQWVFALTQNSDLGPKVSAGLCPLPQGPGFVCTGIQFCAWSCQMHLKGHLLMQDQVRGHSGLPTRQRWSWPLPRASALSRLPCCPQARVGQ